MERRNLLDNKIISKCMFIISVHEKCIFEYSFYVFNEVEGARKPNEKQTQCRSQFSFVLFFFIFFFFLLRGFKSININKIAIWGVVYV